MIDQLNAIAVEGAFKTLMAAKWTPATFVGAYRTHLNQMECRCHRGGPGLLCEKHQALADMPDWGTEESAMEGNANG